MWAHTTFHQLPVLYEYHSYPEEDSPRFAVDIIFTLKNAGNMSDENSSEIVKNFTPIVLCQQVHSTNITEINHCDITTETQKNIFIVKNCDGLATSKKNLWLGIRTADCAPVMMFSYLENRIAALHVGREGAIKGILGKAVRDFFKEPGQIHATIGPHIKKCCYHFDNNNDITTQFGGFYSSSTKKIDLTGYIRDKLIKCGLKDENIYISDYCTCCGGEDRFFSHKRSGGKEKARHLTAIRMRNL